MIAASGTLAQIIPPSLVLIVLASQLVVPVGDMYQTAFKPGLMLMGLYGAVYFHDFDLVSNGFLLCLNRRAPSSAPRVVVRAWVP